MNKLKDQICRLDDVLVLLPYLNKWLYALGVKWENNHYKCDGNGQHSEEGYRFFGEKKQSGLSSRRGQEVYDYEDLDLIQFKIIPDRKANFRNKRDSYSTEGRVIIYYELIPRIIIFLNLFILDQ